MKATFKTSDFVSNVKAALLAASTDETRQHLNCIRIEFIGPVARFVATNGHWMWINETNLIAPSSGVDEKGRRTYATLTEEATIHLGVADATRILKTLEKGKKALAWDVEIDTKGTVKQLSVSTTFAPNPDLHFPPHREVIPRDAERTGEGKQQYAACLLIDVANAFAEVSSRASDATGLDITPCGGARDPAVVTSACCSALAVLMPMRADSTGVQSKINHYRGTKEVAAAAE